MADSEGDRSTARITQLLIAWSDGGREALDALSPLVYDELRRIAARYLRHEPGDHTLQPTPLVHEAYVRLIDQRRVRWRNRAHFYGVAAQMMRRILVDHARARRAGKRGAGWDRLPLVESEPPPPAMWTCWRWMKLCVASQHSMRSRSGSSSSGTSAG